MVSEIGVRNNQRSPGGHAQARRGAMVSRWDSSRARRGVGGHRFEGPSIDSMVRRTQTAAGGARRCTGAG
eukprot:SAG31_NODE_237_length_19590_cov_13.149915_15_plen_70_part_00